MVTGKQ